MSSKSLAYREEIHLARKAWHVIIGLIGISIYYLSNVSIVEFRWLSLFIAIGGFTVDSLRLKNPKLNDKVIKYFHLIMRRSEENSFSGLPFYALGVTLSLFFYKEDIAVLSILFLVIADPMASLVGVVYGKDKILSNKSLQGTIAAFVTCSFITYFYTFDFNGNILDALLFSVVCGIIGSVSELFSAFNIDDNLTIPVLSGAGISCLNFFFSFL